MSKWEPTEEQVMVAQRVLAENPTMGVPRALIASVGPEVDALREKLATAEREMAQILSGERYQEMTIERDALRAEVARLREQAPGLAAEVERVYPEELRRKGGQWLGALRIRIRWIRSGPLNDGLVWGSNASPTPPFTMADVELLGAEAAAAALNDAQDTAASKRRHAPTPTPAPGIAAEAAVVEAVLRWQDECSQQAATPNLGLTRRCNDMLLALATATLRPCAEVAAEAVAAERERIGSK